MNRKNKIYSGILTLLFFIALTSFAFTPAGEWIGNTVSGFLNPATEDLDMANNDIKMGTGLIGYDGTAAKGLSFDSGNEKVVVESGVFLVPVGTKTNPPLAVSGNEDLGIYFTASSIEMSVNDNAVFKAEHNNFSAGTGGSWRPTMYAVVMSPTVPGFTGYADTNTGLSIHTEDQASLVTGGRETMRMISFADTDVANDEVVVTGVSGYHGLVLVRSLTDNTSAIYRVSNTTVIDVSLDGDHTSTVTTAGHYNFYYDTDQFKLENKAGAGKSVSVAFWVLPT